MTARDDRRQQLLAQYAERLATHGVALCEDERGEHLSPEHLGEFWSAASTVWIKPDLWPGQLRGVLEHETLHVELGHGLNTAAAHERWEVIVQEEVARRLITVDQLTEALQHALSQHRRGFLGALCEVLEVSRSVALHRLETLTVGETAMLGDLLGAREVGARATTEVRRLHAVTA